MIIAWLDEAVEDRQQQWEYVASNHHVEVAIRSDGRIDQQVELLTRYPEMGRVGRFAGTRELVINGSPYVLVYRLTKSGIEILRLLHGAQMCHHDASKSTERCHQNKGRHRWRPFSSPQQITYSSAPPQTAYSPRPSSPRSTTQPGTPAGGSGTSGSRRAPTHRCRESGGTPEKSVSPGSALS